MAMERFVLIHSPLVGRLTWSLVADHMRRLDLTAFIPTLSDSPDSKEPYWKQHAASVARILADIPKDAVLTLVAHSGAGPLLPAIRQSIPNPVHAYVFVDAGIPRNTATRLDLMKLEDLDWANDFERQLERGERFPTWSMDDLQSVIQDDALRRQMVAELHPRGSDFFTEPIPVFAGWPDAPCIYVQFTSAYDWDSTQAQGFGWPTYKLEAGHFHMLVDAKEVTEIILAAVNKLP